MVQGFQVRRLDGVVGQEVADRLQAGGKAGDDLRPVAGQRLRHILVGGALARPFGIELRVGLIGLGQRIRQVLGARLRGSKNHANQHAKANARSKHAPCNVANPSGTPNHLIP